MDRDSVPEKDLQALRQAFEIFTEASGQLGSSWRDLELQVARLEGQLATARDERQHEAERNQQLVRRLGTVLETLPGGLIVVDGDGRVNEVNSVARQLFGEPLEGMLWSAVSQRAFAGRSDAHGDFLLADGRHLSLAQRALADGADGGAAGRVLLFTDITEQRKIEHLLDRHRRLVSMGEMAAGLAHQVRTPLSSALLYASNATRPELSASYRAGLLDKSIACLRDLEQLVGDMLSFARGASYVEASFLLDDVLAALGTSVAPVLGEQQELVISTAPVALELQGNREAIVGALINLVRNALQAAGAEARVTVSAAECARGVELRVADNGPGVAAEQAEKIFEPFVSLRSDGTGLGLAVVRSVARAHGGEVYLADNSAAGATFVLQLPLRAAAAAAVDRADAGQSLQEGAAA
jgi:two-component system sensor histidine kinase FlrB